MPSPTPRRIAYFCMEYALRDDLALYAGGLGVLAGDVLKAAHDLKLDMVGIGIFWAEGYVHQRIGDDGWPQNTHVRVRRELLQPLDVDVSVRVRGKDVRLAAYEVSPGSHAPLYLLEPADEEDRWITRRLYQGGHGDRVAQEIVLGVGGVRLLRALGRHVDVHHLNEGHAVFAGLELAREELARGLAPKEALARVRERIVFTTHTPVMAGNEAHDVSLLMEQGVHLDTFSREDLTELGGDPFNMTEAGLRLSRRANAVAALHGRTAQGMWGHVRDGAPIIAITNGVHVPTWQDARIRRALDGGDLPAARRELKHELLSAIELRAHARFDPERLLVGFARRTTHYKRIDLLFRELDVLEPLLGAGLQLVYAGKAYPDDAEGRGLVARVVGMARSYPGSVAWLEDYDLELGRLLTRGCDAWLNMPIRPLEASGTSGMKSALNGGLNVSVLDGWWDEGCEDGVNGWQFGDAYQGPGQDEHDLHALQALLANQVLPAWHDRPRWEGMMRAAIATATERFSASRMLIDYVERLYAV